MLRTILIDDHALFLDALEFFLRKSARVQVVGKAYSGRGGIQLAARLFPDLVLVDFSMPDMNGAEVTRELKSQPLPPVVIVISSHVQNEYRDMAIAAGANGYVVKSDLAVLTTFLTRIDGTAASTNAKPPWQRKPQAWKR